MSANPPPEPRPPKIVGEPVRPSGPDRNEAPRFAPGSDEEYDWIRDEELLKRAFGGES